MRRQPQLFPLKFLQGKIDDNLSESEIKPHARSLIINRLLEWRTHCSNILLNNGTKLLRSIMP